MLPALSRYGVMPWHLAAMPRAEIAEYVLDLIETSEAAQESQGGG